MSLFLLGMIYMRRYEEYTIQFDEIPARRTKWNVIYEMLDSLSLAVLLVMVLFAFVCRPFWVSGASMEPTLLDRNWVAVTTLGFLCAARRYRCDFAAECAQRAAD